MELNEIRRIKRKEKKLLKELERLKNKEKDEIFEVKDEIKKIEDELEEISKKVSLLEQVEKKKINYFRRFWNFLKEDSLQSWVTSLILLVVFIKFIFFPVLNFITGSPLPLVIVESCSMYHDSDFEGWWERNGAWYEEKSIGKEDFMKFPFIDGLDKGDIIFVWGRSEPKLGDIIIFEPNPESISLRPIIHRVVTLQPLGTKGDNGKTNLQQLKKGNNAMGLDETNIPYDRYKGEAMARVPLLGWIKLIFFEQFRPKEQRGFCS